MAKKRGKDLVTKAMVDALIAERRKSSGRQSSGSTRTKKYSDESYSTRALVGDVQLRKDNGRDRYVAGKGIKENELKDSKTREYLEQTRAADAEAKALGKEREKSNGLVSRAFDVLSRFNYGSAEAFRRAGTLEDDKFWDVGAGFDGFWEGLKGKKKTTFSDVLKEHDNLKGWQRAAVGFGLDVVADPLTWTGVGLVPKVAGGSNKAVKLLNKTASAENKILETAGSAGNEAARKAVRDATQAQNLNMPAEAIKRRHLKNLTPEGRALYDAVRDSSPNSGGATYAQGLVKKFKKDTKAYTRTPLGALGDEGVVKAVNEAVEREVKDYPTMRGFLDKVSPGFNPSNPTWLAWATRWDNKKGSNISLGSDFTSMDKMRALGEKELLNNPNFGAVKFQDPETYVKSIVTHEIGHTVSYAMPSEVVAKIRDRLFKEAGIDDLPPSLKGPDSLRLESDKAFDLLNDFPDLPKSKLNDLPQSALNFIKRGFKDNFDSLTLNAIEDFLVKKFPDKIKSGEIVDALKQLRLVDDAGNSKVNSPKLFEVAEKLLDSKNIAASRKIRDANLAVGKLIHKDISDYATTNIAELMAEAWAVSRLQPDKASPIAKWIADEMAANVPKGPTFKETSKILRELADDSVLNSSKFDEVAEATINDSVKAANKAKSDEIYEQLLALTARNMSAKVGKQVSVRLGPTAVGIPKSAEAVELAAKTISSIPFIKKSVDTFNKAFRAKAHIPPGLDHLRAQEVGRSTMLITAHIKELQSIFDSVPKAARHSVMQALRDNALNGNKIAGGPSAFGNEVGDLVSYTHNQLMALDVSRKNAGLTLKEINAFLGSKHYLTVPFSFQKTEKVIKTNPDGTQTLTWNKVGSQQINQNALYESIMANKNIKDPAEAIYLYSAAVNQAIAKREMWDNISKTHGVPGDSELAKDLTGKFGWRSVDINPDTKDWLFPPEIATGMEKINDVFRDARSTGQFIDMFDRSLQTFKSIVTRYNPSFHSRTLLGEMLLGYMGGMKNMPASYRAAGKVIKGRNQQFLGGAQGVGPEGVTNPTVSKALTQAANLKANSGSIGMRLGNDISDGSNLIINHKKFGRLTADKIWHMYLDMGLKSGFASTDLVRGAQTPVGGKLVTTRNVVQAATEGVEDYGRLAHFIDAIKYSKARTLEEAVNEAAFTVRKYHLDYNAVTGLEKNILTRAIPFYKWIRLSTPLMAEIIMTKPGKALAVPKAMKSISEAAGYDTDQFGPFPGGADAVVPEWLRDNAAVPWAEFGGNTNYFDPTALFPLAGSAETIQSGGIDSLNPFFKIASDLYRGNDKFGNQLRGEAASGESQLNYAAALTPQTSFLNQMITNKDPGIPKWQTLAQFLANPGNQPNTEKRMRGEAFRQRQAAYANRREAKRESGLLP